MGQVTMPKMGEAMEEGTLIRWLKKEGDPVAENEAIAEVETDKAAMEIPSFDAGTVSRLLIKEGETVPVGTPIALVLAPGETEAVSAPATPAPSDAAPAQTAPPQEQAAAQESQEEEPPAVTAGAPEPQTPFASAQTAATSTPSTAPAPGAPVAPPAPEEAPTGNGDRVFASPLAKKIASEAGVDLRALQGTGPKGRIVEQDVKEYLQRTPHAPETTAPAPQPTAQPVAPQPALQPATPAAPATTPAPALAGTERKLSNMRKTIAKRLLESTQSVPHFYITTDVDMKAAQEFHSQIKAAAVEGRAKPTLADMIVKACALALAKYPDVNAQFTGESLRYPANVNVGYAVTVEAGLFVPVIRECERKTLHWIAADRRALVEKTQAGKLTPPEYEGGTFTVSNLGTFDVESFIAIVNPPQSAILAVASIVDTVVAVDGAVAVRPRMKLTLSADHRVVDGVLAAQFLQEVKRLLQSPLSLVE